MACLVGYLRLRAFLTTLVTLIIVRAIVDTLILKYQVLVSNPTQDSAAWNFMGDGSLWGFPCSFLVALVVAVVAHVFLTRLKLGWHIQAVGGSRRSAHNAGISVRRTVCLTYVISGALAAAAGVLYAARLNAAGSDTGAGLEVSALTAAVLGGVSLGGGRGSVVKGMLGAVIVLIIQSSLVQLGLRSGAGSLVLGHRAARGGRHRRALAEEPSQGALPGLCLARPISRFRRRRRPNRARPSR